MTSRIAIVTGASSGIGLVTSIELAKKGFLVKAMIRDLTKLPQLIDIIKSQNLENSIEFLPLDVTCTQSITNFKENIIRQLKRIDVLVNNAGFASAGFSEEIPLEEYKKQFETNFFGLISTTQAVLPKMREQKSGKIINISSISGKFGYPSLSPYVSSKFAVEGYSESLRFELKPFGIDVVLIEPGSFQTSIWSTGNHVTEKSKQESSPYYFYMKKMEDIIHSDQDKFGNPEDIAKLIGKLALQKEIKRLRYTIGKGVKASIFLKGIIPWPIWEKIVLKRILK